MLHIEGTFAISYFYKLNLSGKRDTNKSCDTWHDIFGQCVVDKSIDDD